MINKEKNVRVQLTLSKKQFAWIEKFAKAKKLTISKLVAWLLLKKTREVDESILLNEKPQEATQEIEDQEIDEIIESIQRRKELVRNRFSK